MTDKPGSIVVLSGAGISAESGIATFRAKNGLWEGHRIEDVATPEGFARNPSAVYQFYNQRRRQLLHERPKPNAAHLALARLEQLWPDDFMLITQNVDDLHELAGSQHVIHMHGQLTQARCIETHQVIPCLDDLNAEHPCPCCQKPGQLRPHIVWFGEMPLHLDIIYPALHRCAYFVAIGTSGQVYPAAGFVQEVRLHGRAKTIELNLESSELSHVFEEQRLGPASQVVPTFVDELLNQVLSA